MTLPRSGPSGADKKIQAGVAELGLDPPSLPQLEYWRQKGLLERNPRHYYPGRGHGSSSEPAPGAVETAAALTRYTRPGRDLKLALIDWFGDAEFGAVFPSGVPVPEPPVDRVKEAVQWSFSSSHEYRLFELARAAHSDDPDGIEDEAVEKFNEAVENAPRRLMLRPAVDVTAMRRRLETGAHVPIELIMPSEGPETRRTAMMDMLRAVGMGYAEVGGELLDKAFAEYSPGEYPLWVPRTEAQWQDWIESDELSENPVAPAPLELLSLADGEAVRLARAAAYGLAWTGWLFRAHGLLMPDTPAQQQLRAATGRLGIGQITQRVAELVLSTEGFGHVVVCCLDPTFYAMSMALMVKADELEPLFGDNLEEFTASWQTRLHQAFPKDVPAHPPVAVPPRPTHPATEEGVTEGVFVLLSLLAKAVETRASSS